MSEALLEVRDLKVHFPLRGGIGTPGGMVKAVDGISLDLQAGKTLAELRNTPMFEQLTSGDAEREERIGSLIELHLAAYRKRKQPDSEPAAETIPDTFSISDIV